jgi:hypothetical protein
MIKLFFKMVFLIFSPLLSMLVTGCGVNNWGCVKVCPFENDSAYVMEIEAWGVHLSSRSIDTGITIGHTKKIYVMRKNDLPPFQEEKILFCDQLKPIDHIPAKENWENIIAIIDGVHGVKFYLNSWRGFGFMAGVQNYAALRLPKEFDNINQSSGRILGNFPDTYNKYSWNPGNKELSKKVDFGTAPAGTPGFEALTFYRGGLKLSVESLENLTKNFGKDKAFTFDIEDNGIVSDQPTKLEFIGFFEGQKNSLKKLDSEIRKDAAVQDTVKFYSEFFLGS